MASFQDHGVSPRGDALRICLVTEQFGSILTGVGTYATSLARGLAGRGHTVHVVCPDDSSPIPEIGERYVTVSRFPHDPSHNDWFSLSIRFSKALKRLMEAQAFDLVHFTDAREALFTGVPGGTALVGTVHDYYFAVASKDPRLYRRFYADWLKRYLYYNAVHLLEPIAYRRCTRLIAVCEAVRRRLGSEYDIGEDRVEVVYNGFNPPSEDVTGSVRGPRRPLILFAGGNFQRKGLAVLIRSAPSVLEKVPEAEFFVAGRDRNERHLARLASSLGVDHRFHFLGRVPPAKMASLFREAAVFAMPSLIESFAFVFLEAMAFGAVPVGGEVGGTKELIRDGVDGFLIPRGDWKTLADRLIVLLSNSEKRQQMAEAGRSRIMDYPVEGMVEATERVYRSAMAGIERAQASPHRGQ